jgi:hypothetical protein
MSKRHSPIAWADSLIFGSDVKSRGVYGDGGSGGVFVIRFFRSADGRCISLKHGGEFVGAFRSVGAAKRRAVQIVNEAVASKKAVQP